MRANTLNWIVLFMTVALVGLVVFQTYWIRGALKINREKFTQNVHEALRSVSDQLEQQEVMVTLYNKMLFQNGRNGEYNRADSAYYWPEDSLPEMPRGGLMYSKNLRTVPNDSTIIRSETHTRSMRFRGRADSGTMQGSFESNFRLEFQQFGSGDSLPYGSENLRMENIRQKSQMVTIVLDELLTNRRNIRSRVHPRQVDTLLNAALKDRGIDIPYYYGILNDETKTVVMASSKDVMRPLVHSEFKTGLFTRDVLSSPNKLAVHFPGQRQFLLGKIWITLASSGLLLLTIMICFAYALHIIVRQKKISEIKNDFINNMTHEFKTPISTVSLACEALRDEELQHNDQFVNKYLGIIQAENSRLGMQVERVLQIAKLERKDIKLKPEVLDLHQIVEEAVQNIRIQVEKRHGSIHARYNATHTLVYADEVHLTNIVFNLLDNANKYTAAAPTITVETRNSRDKVILCVSDEGIGMSPEVSKRIFEKFYRVPTGNIHNVKGFGLGLTYVKTMVELMHGQIDVQSEPGTGSTFTVTLPIYENREHPSR